jgi:hypothetical protein
MDKLWLPAPIIGIKNIGAAIIVTTIVLSGSALADQKGGGGTSGGSGPECYNQVTEDCNTKYPGKDYGDAEYKACIDRGLDACDVLYPNMKGQGRPPVSRLPGREMAPGTMKKE